MDHANSQRAREFLQNYVSGNRKLITDWLDGFAAMISGEAGKVVMDWGVASSQNTQGVKVVAVSAEKPKVPTMGRTTDGHFVGENTGASLYKP